jgi:hypothetical protein
MTESSQAAEAATPSPPAVPASNQSGAPPLPAFHITHWKAGSEWVRAVLHALAPEHFVPRRQMHGHLYQEPIREGGIYSPIYMHRREFERLVTVPHARFIVIRDLRDTLISWYFSARYSHPTTGNPGLAGRRADLEHLDQEEGILYMLENRLRGASKIQSTWAIAAQEEEARMQDASAPRTEYIVRYEDLWADQVTGFTRICNHIGLKVGPGRLQKVVENMSFESRSGGRKPGEEDVTSHFRKGVPGDWRTHFTPRITAAFKNVYGRVLIRTGYEESLDW